MSELQGLNAALSTSKVQTKNAGNNPTASLPAQMSKEDMKILNEAIKNNPYLNDLKNQDIFQQTA